MAFKDFSNQLYIKTLDTGEEGGLGTFTLTQNFEVNYMQMPIYVHGALGGTERLRINVYSSTNSSLLMQSDWSNLSDIDNIGAYWIGKIRFNFTRKYLQKTVPIVLKLEVDNYTRNGDTFYIGYVLDWPLETNQQDSTPPLGADVAIVGYA